MQITLNIDATTLKDTVEETLRAMSESERKALCREMLVGALCGKDALIPEDVRRKETAKKVGSDYGYNFDKELGKAPRYYLELAVRDIVDSCIQHHRAELAEFVKTDPTCLKVLESLKEQFRDDFHKTVHDSLVLLFCSKLDEVGRQIGSALMDSQQAKEITEKLTKRLAS